MATLSVGLPRSAQVLRRRRLKAPAVLGTIRGRVYLTLALVILLTLTITGVTFFFLLGGYQDRLATSTLRQVGVPVYESVTLAQAADPTFRAFEVSRQLQGTVGTDSDVLILFLDDTGRVVSEASRAPRFRGERLDLDFDQIGVGQAGFLDATVRTEDGTLLNVLTTGLEPDAVERFNAAYVALALPNENRQAVLGDLMPRLIIATALALTAAVVVGLLLSRTIYRPLQAATAAARSVARGRFTQKVEVTGTQEARELADAFNHMSDEVQRQQAALRDFLANVSHDLQTPLTSINGFSQALVDGTVDAPEARQNAYRIIEEESRRLLRLVEGLLDLSRIEAGQAQINLQPIRIAALLQHIQDLFALRANELEVRLTLGSSDVPDVRGDPDRLEQVLANLVDNALRHTPPEGEVRVSARRESDATVGIAVSDTGPGIPADAMPRLFSRFYQSERSQGQGGTGLGLAIAHELVQAQQGEIQVESQPGSGATFRVLLRIHQPQPPTRRFRRSA